MRTNTPLGWLVKNKKMIGDLRHNDWLRWIAHSILCAIFIGIFTVTDFWGTPLNSTKDYLIILSHWASIVFACTCVNLILTLLPHRGFVIVYATITFLASILAFYRYTMNFTLNTMMLDIILQNDLAVSADMLEWPIFVWVLCATTISILIANLRKQYIIKIKNRWTIGTVILASLTLILLLAPTSRFSRPILNRIPFNIVEMTTKYISERQEITNERPRVFKTANAQSDSLTVVFIIGEALRPSNLHINGYRRENTPNMERLGVVSFDSVWSDYVYTNRSVPHILTRADTSNPNLAYTERSFIDVFNAAGFNTIFLGNQDAEKPYAYFTKEAQTSIFVNLSKGVYNYDKWLDEDILPVYQKELAKNNKQQLFVLHTIGSHWWYNVHYSDSFEIYKPVMKSRIVASCDSMEIVNSYDNTVAYTDWFISQIIEPLKNLNAICIFLSDHGEALGENGQWLHASESTMMNWTAAFVWMSDKYKQKYPYFNQNINHNKHQFYKTDFLFHSIIDAANIQTDVLDTTLSIFR